MTRAANPGLVLKSGKDFVDGVRVVSVSFPRVCLVLSAGNTKKVKGTWASLHASRARVTNKETSETSRPIIHCIEFQT